MDIIKVLVRHGPLKIAHIRRKANVDSGALPQYLDFLIRQYLVEQQALHKARVVYAITDRGRTVLKFFRELSIALPIIEGAPKIPALLC